MHMNRAQKLYLEIRDLEIQLNEEQEKCEHPNLDLDDNADPFADPFAGKCLCDIKEYRCPDCLLVIVK